MIRMSGPWLFVSFPASSQWKVRYLFKILLYPGERLFIFLSFLCLLQFQLSFYITSFRSSRRLLFTHCAFVLAFLSSERNLQFIYRRTILRAYERSYAIRGRVQPAQTGDTRIIEELGMSCTSIFTISTNKQKKPKQSKN